jgi:hypothetical protein
VGAGRARGGGVIGCCRGGCWEVLASIKQQWVGVLVALKLASGRAVANAPALVHSKHGSCAADSLHGTRRASLAVL